LIRFLPAATGRNVMDFSQKSLHVDAQVKLHTKPTFFEILL
jgi:hypothetical protein